METQGALNLSVHRQRRKLYEIPGVARRQELQQFGALRTAEMPEARLEFVVLSSSAMLLIPLAIEDEMVRPQQQILEVLDRITKGPVEEVWRATHDSVRRLEDKLQRAELVARPMLS